MFPPTLMIIFNLISVIAAVGSLGALALTSKRLNIPNKGYLKGTIFTELQRKWAKEIEQNIPGYEWIAPDILVTPSIGRVQIHIHDEFRDLILLAFANRYTNRLKQIEIKEAEEEVKLFLLSSHRD